MLVSHSDQTGQSKRLDRRGKKVGSKVDVKTDKNKELKLERSTEFCMLPANEDEGVTSCERVKKIFRRREIQLK